MGKNDKLSAILFFGGLLGIFVAGFLMGMGIAVVNSIGWGMVAFVFGVVFALFNLLNKSDQGGSKEPK